MDVGAAAGVPSVMPLSNLMGGDNLGMSGAPSTALLEEINQKKAYIASLEAQLSSTKGSQSELEVKVNSAQGNLSSAEKKIKELETKLSQAMANVGTAGGESSDNSNLLSELQTTQKERDEIRDRLKEFEIISDDLANLKRLQQENEQLKRSLAQAGSTAAPEKAAIDPNNILSQADVSDLLADLGESGGSTSSKDNQALEEFLSSPEEDTSEADMLAAMNDTQPDNNAKSEKTPEDLLSEFEKMLG
jgi:chromosome segregation ATPase